MSNLGDFPVVRARSASILHTKTTKSDNGKLRLTRTYSNTDLTTNDHTPTAYYKPYPFRYSYDPDAFYTTSPDKLYDRQRYFRNYLLNGYYPYSNRYDNHPYSFWYKYKSGGPGIDIPNRYRSYINPYAYPRNYDNYERSNFTSNDSYRPTYWVFRTGYYSRYGTGYFN